MTKTFIDQRSLANLRDIMGEDFTALVDAYLADAEQKINSMQIALEQDDAAGLRACAHSFKGSSSNLGVFLLAAACDELEILALTGAREQWSPAFDEVCNIFARAAIELKEEIG